MSSSSTSSEPKILTHHNHWPRVRMSIFSLERKEKEKKKKEKKKEVPDQRSKEKETKKRKETTARSGPRPALNKNRKGKCPNTQEWQKRKLTYQNEREDWYGDKRWWDCKRERWIHGQRQQVATSWSVHRRHSWESRRETQTCSCWASPRQTLHCCLVCVIIASITPQHKIKINIR